VVVIGDKVFRPYDTKLPKTNRFPLKDVEEDVRSSAG
jgi:hypothetical protein